jgi:hypothetical protein
MIILLEVLYFSQQANNNYENTRLKHVSEESNISETHVFNNI